MTITARVHNRTILLPPDVEVQEGTEVKIIVPEPASETKPSGHAWMLKYAGILDDVPADAGLRHDHYLYGTPTTKPVP